ncbi:MAG: hypothetical protein DLM57_05520 [Pseudonocardiales bacterium]|nr:MAG: hypothetical protein DLM57_05520 [Pseudonocardiales bacterium]
MVNRSWLGLAAVLVLSAAGCGSNSGGAYRAAAERQAKQFTCPAASAVSAALGKTVPAAHRGTVASSSLICSYVDVKAGGANVFVSVTFGVHRDELQRIVKATAEGRRFEPLAGVGDAAFQVPADAKNGPMVFVHSGNRAVSVVEDQDTGTQASTIAVARLFL